MKLAVVGSINMDMTVTAERIPLKGETLTGAGDDLKSALEYANVAAGLSTEKFGAQTGMPTAEEVARVMALR